MAFVFVLCIMAGNTKVFGFQVMKASSVRGVLQVSHQKTAVSVTKLLFIIASSYL